MNTTIAFLIYPGLTPLDMVGPLQVLTVLSRIRPEFQPVVVAESKRVVRGDNGMAFVPNGVFSDLPHPDAILVPGGGGPTLKAMSNLAIRSYMRSAAETASVVASVCTGALLLAAVDLLSGRRATTHWAYRDILERLGACYERKRWVEDGKFITSAGVSAGIDSALRLVSKLTDEATAKEVQLWLDYDPKPPFGGIDYEAMPLMARSVRGMHAVMAPFITRKPKRLTAKGF